jgi:nicotinamidase-related amidase
VTPETLFGRLDTDGDGVISRRDLQSAVRRLGWHWHEAPVMAVLDSLATAGPISPAHFSACMRQMADDPLGPYGEVLRRLSWHPKGGARPAPRDAGHGACGDPSRSRPVQGAGSRTAQTLRAVSQSRSAEDLDDRLGLFAPAALSAAEASLLIIDPQRAFTKGVWMAAIGPNGFEDAGPIRRAFARCAGALTACRPSAAVMFTRCPFPPDSFGWDDSLAGLLAEDQPYFIKPGNSVLFPPLNGFSEWIDDGLRQGRGTLVLGGCTLTSCLRVSAVEVCRRFNHRGLAVVVDLGLAGARARNYRPSRRYGGISPVAAAVRQMAAAGTIVVPRVAWRP